jgi:hypothetical protein
VAADFFVATGLQAGGPLNSGIMRSKFRFYVLFSTRAVKMTQFPIAAVRGAADAVLPQ